MGYCHRSSTFDIVLNISALACNMFVRSVSRFLFYLLAPEKLLHASMVHLAPARLRLRMFMSLAPPPPSAAARRIVRVSGSIPFSGRPACSKRRRAASFERFLRTRPLPSNASTAPSLGARRARDSSGPLTVVSPAPLPPLYTLADAAPRSTFSCPRVSPAKFATWRVWISTAHLLV